MDGGWHHPAICYPSSPGHAFGQKNSVPFDRSSVPHKGFDAESREPVRRRGTRRDIRRYRSPLRLCDSPPLRQLLSEWSEIHGTVVIVKRMRLILPPAPSFLPRPKQAAPYSSFDWTPETTSVPFWPIECRRHSSRDDPQPDIQGSDAGRSNLRVLKVPSLIRDGAKTSVNGVGGASVTTVAFAIEVE